MNPKLVQATEEHLGTVTKHFPRSVHITTRNQTYGDFYKSMAVSQLAPASRMESFLFAVDALSTTVFGKEIAARLVEQIKQRPILSTCEHLALISHPESMIAVTSQALYRKQNDDSLAITFCCGTVPMGSTLLGSRYVFVGSKKVPMFPNRYKHSLAALMPGLDAKQTVSNIKEACLELQVDTQSVLNVWQTLFEPAQRLPQYWQQVGVMNREFWRQFVQASQLDLPSEYLMIPMELIISQTVQRDLEQGNKNWVLNCLLNSGTRAELFSLLSNVRGCWDADQKRGTFLFYGIGEEGKAVALWPAAGDKLVDSSGKVWASLTAEGLAEALRSGRVIASVTLCHLYMAFYLGLHLFGGALQIDYLRHVQECLTSGIARLGLSEEDARIVSDVPTQYFVHVAPYAAEEHRPFTNGGILKLLQPSHPSELDSFAKTVIGHDTQGLIVYQHQMFQKAG